MTTLTVEPSPQTVYVYVDGESNYIRTEAAFRKRYGEDASLSEATFCHSRGLEGSYPDPGPVLRHRSEFQFFWDTSYGRMLRGPIERRAMAKVYYFGAVQGDEDAIHNAAVYMRSNGCTPMLVREAKQLALRRHDRRQQRKLIEKPKGVDSLLVARLLDDAYRGNFDACVLLTSDADFIPAIEIVQRLGKPVLVFGFESGLSERSKLLHVPDVFLDLDPHVQTAYLHSVLDAGG
ncbi:MAG: NYN domain-containing protein [Azoarcus sp.]|nr:NYN domain-containing protein [Azoarcus sp.]